MRILMASDVYFPRVSGVSTWIQTFARGLTATAAHPDPLRGPLHRARVGTAPRCADGRVVSYLFRAIPRLLHPPDPLGLAALGRPALLGQPVQRRGRPGGAVPGHAGGARGLRGPHPGPSHSDRHRAWAIAPRRRGTLPPGPGHSPKLPGPGPSGAPRLRKIHRISATSPCPSGPASARPAPGSRGVKPYIAFLG
jgi:hypothetical protein